VLGFNIFGNILVTLDIRFRAIRCVRKAGLSSEVRSCSASSRCSHSSLRTMRRHSLKGKFSTRGQPGSVRVTSVAELLVGERFHDVVNKRRYYLSLRYIARQHCSRRNVTIASSGEIGCGTIFDFPPAVLS
jgi:hypothetical protein